MSYHEWFVEIQWMFCWVIMNVLSSYHECFVELSWMFRLSYHKCFVELPRMFCLVTMNVSFELSWMFFWVTMNVLLSYHECFVELPWMFCWITMNVLLSPPPALVTMSMLTPSSFITRTGIAVCNKFIYFLFIKKNFFIGLLLNLEGF